ncbi:VanZ family protein [Ornithinimicrobium ciconiae]|uniref:VanZ family protein n=1 Tax=Ornithinimicrobium ciconiae TaxID=2594265 RepID=UPI0013FCFBF9|nr:VanZ family protein [Ornithinimicrobium ciconiae]
MSVTERSAEGSAERSPESSSGAISPRGRRVVWAALVLYLVVLGAIGLWLTSVDDPVRSQVQDLVDWLTDHGAPESFRYGYVEAAANAAVFVPLGFLVALLLRPSRWWLAGLLGLCLSAGIELTQFALLSARVADPVDLLMNTTGAFVGAALGGLVVLALARRRRARSGGFGFNPA